MEAVLHAFTVEQILKPALSTIDTNISKVFETLITGKGIPVEWPGAGDSYALGAAMLTVLSNNTGNYSEVNDFSIVARLVHVDNSFIFTGDAESPVEHEIVASKADIKSTVLKVGHHGGGTSTTAQFAKVVSPKYAVISVGRDNSYGHPDNLVTNRLRLLGAEIWRTDERGTIIFISDGKDLQVTSKKTALVKAVTSTPAPTKKPDPTPSPAPTATAKPTSAPVAGKIEITALDKRAEYVEITNKTNADIDITDWILVSVTGDQRYTFPERSILKAGETIKVTSGDAKDGLHWTNKTVWNNSEDDDAKLLDKTGKLIFHWDD